MAAIELIVTIAGDDKRRHRLDSAGPQLQDVERGLVSPVHVLKHEHGQTPRAQVPRERRYDLVRDCAAVYNLLELAAGVFGDKEQRPERPRSKERIARAPQD